MLRSLFTHIRAHFVGYIALFVALGGTAYAAAPFLSGSGTAKFGRLSMQAGPVVPDTPMQTVLSIDGLGDVLMYCTADDLNPTLGGFAFKNTTTARIFVGLSSRGSLQPGETAIIGWPGTGGTAIGSITSDFDKPDRTAIVALSGHTEGTTCFGNVQLIEQPQ